MEVPYLCIDVKCVFYKALLCQLIINKSEKIERKANYLTCGYFGVVQKG